MQIRLSFPHYIVPFVILGLLFFTASFQATKGIKIAIVWVVSIAAKDFSGDHTNVQLTILAFFLILKEAFSVYDLEQIFTTCMVFFFLSSNWRFKNTYL